jgi:hypothetical protein
MRCYLLLLPLSLIGGLVAAYACVMTLDGRIEVDILTRPAVFPIATVYGLIGGAIISPFLYFCLRTKNKLVAIPFIYGFVVVGTIGLNLVAPPAGFPGAFVLVLAILVLWWRFVPDAKGELGWR